MGKTAVGIDTISFIAGKEKISEDGIGCWL